MSQIVAAVYATHADAEAARQALIVDGFEAAGIKVASLEAPDAVVQPAHAGGIRGFFRSLFGLEAEHPDVERYASAVDSGRAVVTATVDDDRALAAKAVLERYAPVDLPPGEGYVTDTDRLRNGDAEPGYRTTLPFGESISAGAAGATGTPGLRPGIDAVPDSETEARLAQAPVYTPDPYARSADADTDAETDTLRAPVTPAAVYEDPLPGADPSRTQPFTPIAAPVMPPVAPLPEATPKQRSTDLYAARDAALDADAAAGDAHATHRPHELPPLAPVVPPVAPIAPPAGRDGRRRQQR